MSTSDVSQLLSALEQGDPHAAGQLLPLVYEELRRLAAHKLACEAPGQTLQPTALVHEAYLRLVGDESGDRWDNRGHFFAAAAEAMRRILVDEARRKASLKRGGQRPLWQDPRRGRPGEWPGRGHRRCGRPGGEEYDRRLGPRATGLRGRPAGHGLRLAHRYRANERWCVHDDCPPGQGQQDRLGGRARGLIPACSS